MAVTDQQYNILLSRLTRIENVINDLITAHDQFVTQEQVNQLLTTAQAGLDSLGSQVDALEDRVTSIEEEPA